MKPEVPAAHPHPILAAVLVLAPTLLPAQSPVLTLPPAVAIEQCEPLVLRTVVRNPGEGAMEVFEPFVQVERRAPDGTFEPPPPMGDIGCGPYGRPTRVVPPRQETVYEFLAPTWVAFRPGVYRIRSFIGYRLSNWCQVTIAANAANASAMLQPWHGAYARDLDPLGEFVQATLFSNLAFVVDDPHVLRQLEQAQATPGISPLLKVALAIARSDALFVGGRYAEAAAIARAELDAAPESDAGSLRGRLMHCIAHAEWAAARTTAEFDRATAAFDRFAALHPCMDANRDYRRMDSRRRHLADD